MTQFQPVCDLAWARQVTDAGLMSPSRSASALRPLVLGFLVAVLVSSGCADSGDDGPSTTTVSNDTDTDSDTDTETSTTAGCDACDPSMPPRCVGNQLVSCEVVGECAMEVFMSCPVACSGNACTDEVCGDGSIASSEVCDDGNATPGDGCSPACDVEPGWMCDDLQPSTCVASNLSIQITDVDFNASALTVTYVVRNDSDADIDGYRVDLWGSRSGRFANPPAVGEEGDLVLMDHPALTAGQSATFTETIEGVADGSDVAFAVVDTMDALPESDENDNVSLGFAWTSIGGTRYDSFAFEGGPQPIPGDGSVASATVNVDIFQQVQFYASVNITHPALAQLTVRLVAPNGAELELVSGLTGANLGGTTFGTEFGDIGGATAPYVGAFAPASNWNMPPDANGTFSLQVEDAGGEPGTLNAFTLTVLDP